MDAEEGTHCASRAVTIHEVIHHHIEQKKAHSTYASQDYRFSAYLPRCGEGAKDMPLSSVQRGCTGHANTRHQHLFAVEWMQQNGRYPSQMADWQISESDGRMADTSQMSEWQISESDGFLESV